MAALDSLDRRLIDAYQRGLPLVAAPYAAMAEQLGVSESEVVERLQRLQALDVLSRVGPVFDHARAGASLLAAVSVPETERDEAAAMISRCPEVNHNYAREHRYNLWFVMTAADETQLGVRLDTLEAELGRPLLRLPMLEGFHIDLGFPIPWAELESS
ncbi:Lrp/AsnC family transcriptional regulator [Billgrantia endophytica]|uniref:siroheme decarboxylase n=1 Tax=Billgrantia endophytica TaxID=2033802 RepID=A0A2N7UAF1_9GAMM|nr:Lrp/AsnC family transcriptional regulator [Halomonas endophytica]PMR77424.1 AsnC family protein [Halomonas endophytica]